MAVLNALRQTPSALQRNPVLFVPVFVILLFQVPQLVLQAVDPLLASLVSFAFSILFVFVLPFFQGGIVGMADEALDGQTSLDSFVDAGRSNYVSLFVAYLVVLAVNVAIGIVAFFAAIPVGAAFLADLGGSVGLAVLVVAGLILLLVGLAYLLFLFFVQFYGQAIVIDDLGAVDGLTHSVRVVRRNLASTLGYTVLVAVLGGLAGIVFAVPSILGAPQTTSALALPRLSVVATAGATVVAVALGTLFGGFFSVYSVAFYRAINP
jgi:hypothetical protein